MLSVHSEKSEADQLSKFSYKLDQNSFFAILFSEGKL